MQLHEGDKLICYIRVDYSLTVDKIYKIEKIFEHDNAGPCIAVLDDNNYIRNYTINVYNGLNYKNYFKNNSEIRKEKLSTILKKQNITEDNLS